MTEKITRNVHGHKREVTVNGESHEGKCVVSFNEDAENWTVLCPAGHFITKIDDPNGLYGIDHYKNKNVSCSGTLQY